MNMQSLEKYLESLCGEPVEVFRGDSRRTAELPLVLRSRYDLASVKLFGRSWWLAIEKPDWEPGSPTEYRQHAEKFGTAVGEAVAMVIPSLPAYSRARLIKAKVPFVVPGRQLFLPEFLVDLREQFLSPTKTPVKKLSPVSQFILLYQLQVERLDMLSLKDIGVTIGYSPMMITRAKDELEELELCEVIREGRFIRMRFETSRRALWSRALPALSSPVLKQHWVTGSAPTYPALSAGISALSKLTMLSDDRVPTYALQKDTYRKNLEKGIYTGSPDEREATAQIEEWKYNPLLLGDGIAVDPLSLYLSLRDSTDERVQHELEQLMEDISW